VQQERGAFVGSEPFQQQQKGDRQIVGEFELPRRVVVLGFRGAPGFRQPRTDVGFAARFAGAQRVDAQARHRGAEPGAGFADFFACRAMPAQVGLLNEIFRFGNGTEHAIAKSDEARPMRLEIVEPTVVASHAAARAATTVSPPTRRRSQACAWPRARFIVG